MLPLDNLIDCCIIDLPHVRFFLEIVMADPKLSFDPDEIELLIAACQTLIQVRNRAAKAATNGAIAKILLDDAAKLVALGQKVARLAS